MEMPWCRWIFGTVNWPEFTAISHAIDPEDGQDPMAGRGCAVSDCVAFYAACLERAIEENDNGRFFLNPDAIDIRLRMGCAGSMLDRFIEHGLVEHDSETGKYRLTRWARHVAPEPEPAKGQPFPALPAPVKDGQPQTDAQGVLIK